MDKKETVFLIEDDSNYIEIYQQVLNTDFNTRSFTSAADALEKFNELKPKTIVLDLNLPEMNGIEFCNRLFSDYCSTTDIDIIFVSGETDPKQKLLTFEVGAADYLTKPFELKELFYKVSSSVKRQLKEEHLVEEASQSKQLIYTTMEQASQYSQVMDFFKNLSFCRSTADVANVFFESMKFFGLNTSIRFKLPSVSYFRQDGLSITPIEADVYALLEDRGRLFEFSNRLIINDKHVSFIIKNPPSDDHSLGQVRDYTAAIIEGLEAKLLELYATGSMDNVICELSTNIDELKQGISQHSQQVNGVMSNMMGDISASFHSLEMTEEQEAFLSKLLENGANQLNKSEDYLVDVMSRLESLKAQMEAVQEAVNQKQPESNDFNDIELF